MNHADVQKYLNAFPSLKIAVIGDFFLDQYLLIDPELDEPSLETGLTAYQVIGKRRSPGAAGTVVNNLRALGVGTVYAVGFSGVDGEGLELRMELQKIGVELGHFLAVEERFTPTYTKPMVLEKNGENGVIREKELNRFDVKNRKELPPWVEYQLEKAIERLAGEVDAIMIMDQVSERNCGVITDRIREKLIALGTEMPSKIIYADSRERISLYRNVHIKCNHYELIGQFHPEYDLEAIAKGAEVPEELLLQCGRLSLERTSRALFVTLGGRGQWVFQPESPTFEQIPAFLVEGPIDICGAGDACSSGIVSALCAGATLSEAARFGNLVASITIRKLGTTGTASAREILDAV